MADFRRQTPAGELQISVAEITEAADPLGPRLETPLVFSIARFPFAKRKSSFPDGEPEVRIHLPPADSLSLSRSRFRRSRTRLSARVWAAGLAIGSAETLGFFDIAPIGGNISVGPNSSTAVRLMWWRD